MATLQVRNLPDDVYFELCKEAKKQHRTISQQAIVTLVNGLKINQYANQNRLDLLKRLKAEKKPTIALSDPTKLIRQNRDR